MGRGAAAAQRRGATSICHERDLIGKRFHCATSAPHTPRTLKLSRQVARRSSNTLHGVTAKDPLPMRSKRANARTVRRWACTRPFKPYHAASGLQEKMPYTGPPSGTFKKRKSICMGEAVSLGALMCATQGALSANVGYASCMSSTWRTQCWTVDGRKRQSRT